ncbi:MAG: YhfC family glutamic-type intramembrane protease [Eubacterium sp.]|nr:YhfC family glutamic-type intramembrane protease [Eubacterium sp.]
MTDIVFSSEQITTFIVMLALIVLLPIVFFVRFYMTHKPKLVSFFVGCLGGFMVVAGKYLLDMIFVVWLGLGEFINPDIHPVYTALYVALITAIMMTFATWILLRYGMVGREGRENALLMLIGKGGIYAVAYGAVSMTTYLSVALTVNQNGLASYLQPIAEQATRDAQQKAVTALAGRSVVEIVSEGLFHILIMFLQIALGVLIYMSIHKTKDILSKQKMAHIKNKEKQDLAWYEKRTEGLIPLTVLLQALAIFPFAILQVGLATDYSLIMAAAVLLLTIMTCFGCYTVYKQLN